MERKDKYKKIFRSLNDIELKLAKPKELLHLIRKHQPSTCYYCHQPNNPTWSSISLGIICCTSCAGNYRSNTSLRVRSILFDKLSLVDIKRILVGSVVDEDEDRSLMLDEEIRLYDEYVSTYSVSLSNSPTHHDNSKKIEKTLNSINSNSKLGRVSIDDIRAKHKVNLDVDSSVKVNKATKVNKAGKPKQVQTQPKPPIKKEDDLIMLDRPKIKYTYNDSDDIGLVENNQNNKSDRVKDSGMINYDNYNNLLYTKTTPNSSTLASMKSKGKEAFDGFMSRFKK